MTNRRVLRAWFFPVALLGIVALHPLLVTDVQKVILGVYLVAVLVGSLLMLPHSRHSRNIAFLLGGAALLCLGIAGVVGTQPARVLAIAGLTALQMYVVWHTYARVVIRSHRVNAEVFYAAIAVYVMLALLWAGLFELTESLIPNSFAYQTATKDIDEAMLYFSCMTLTTVGYGDITPVSTTAQTLASLEAITGVLYMGVTIAKIASLYNAEAEYD
ncbi:MAG: two pore domain potassium channel family protein [Phycisphaeraceae bacterium]|nr:two pore domain potassium channel family protein [Phycisphaeraceae bacterium]